MDIMLTCRYVALYLYSPVTYTHTPNNAVSYTYVY